MNVLDLFSGIGGFSLGLERAGMRTVAFCEIDAYCRRVLAKHWPDIPCYDDIRTLTAERLAADGISVDLICGGFPCQDISNAGKRAGIGGARSGLWSEYARLIGEIRPRYVIVENVAALLGRGLERVLGDLAALGFDAEWHCIPASAVGAPHRRDRLWLVAYAYANGIASWQQYDAARERRNIPFEDVSADSIPAPMFGPSFFGSEPNGDHAGLGEMADADSAAPQGTRNVREATGRTQTRQSVFSDEDIGWQWRVEPDVGRVAHGVPAELDGSGHAEKEHAAEASPESNGRSGGVPGMRCYGATGTASPGLFKARFGEGLMRALSRQGGPEGWHAPHEGDAQVRPLRVGVPSDAQQEARALQFGMPRDRWPHERSEAVGQIWSAEPDIGRVAHGVPSRVDRLRSLGNAVVPQIPEIIGRAILQAEMRAA